MTGKLERLRPTLPHVMIQQLRMLDTAQRLPLLLAFVALPLVIWPFRLIQFFLIPLVPMLLAAVSWPLLVWQSEGPSQRNYHRSMPVDQTTHDLLKVGAGAIWLLGTVAGTLTLLTLFGLLSGAGGPALFMTPVVWVNFFTATLIVYLLVSVLPLLTDRPLEWLLGLSVGVGCLGVIENPMSGLVSGLIKSPYGPVQALMGGYLGHELRNWPLDEIEIPPDLIEIAPDLTVTNWVVATVVWLSIAGGLVVWASRRANRKEV